MLWESLEAFQKTITCPRLAEAWKLMLLTRKEEDCDNARYWAEYGTQSGVTHFRLAMCAADLARAETRMREALVIATGRGISTARSLQS